MNPTSRFLERCFSSLWLMVVALVAFSGCLLGLGAWDNAHRVQRLEQRIELLRDEAERLTDVQRVQSSLHQLLWNRVRSIQVDVSNLKDPDGVNVDGGF